MIYVLKEERITPACAGSTNEDFKMIFGKKDHPRLRGEYNFLLDGMTAITGSPPLARGVHGLATLDATYYRITPARAGKYASNT